jgi:hypothetical protein
LSKPSQNNQGIFGIFDVIAELCGFQLGIFVTLGAGILMLLAPFNAGA